MAIAPASATPIAIPMQGSGATNVVRAMPSTAGIQTREVEPITAAGAKVKARRKTRVATDNQREGVERILERLSRFYRYLRLLPKIAYWACLSSYPSKNNAVKRTAAFESSL